MRPMSEFRDQLFQGGGGRVVHFSCGHVVDASTQLLPLAVARGPSGLMLDFTYQCRGSPDMVRMEGHTYSTHTHTLDFSYTVVIDHDYIILLSDLTSTHLHLTYLSLPQLEEIGRVLVNVVRVVPGGVVTFLPSYQYEKQVVASLQHSGRWNTIAEKKEVSWQFKGNVFEMCPENIYNINIILSYNVCAFL